jgi:hypothetical protein
MPFLTLEDPNAKIKGSRDPLGAQPVWSRFARHVVTNVTGAANSVRGFTILLLGRYYADRLIESGAVPKEQALDVVLRMEQLGAYARHVGHGVDGDIRGIERVKALLQEHQGRPYIEPGQRGRILSDQRVYGLWGLYTVSSRVSGLVPEGPIGVTEPVAELIEQVYRPKLTRVEPQLLKMLENGGRLDTKGKNPLFKALCELLSEQLSPPEVDFYGRYLRDALETEGAGSRGVQARFVELLTAHTDLNGRFSREESVALAEAAAKTDPELADRLRRIIHLEALLAPADALFDYVLTRNGKTPEELGEKLEEHWGPRVPNLDPETFSEMLPEIESASSEVQARLMKACQAALSGGKYGDAICHLLEWNAELMKSRKAAPWARLSPDGRIEVRYRGAETLLPEEDELGTLWNNQYFVDSLKRITRQLGAGT